jgi:hypothetical protein
MSFKLKINFLLAFSFCLGPLAFANLSCDNFLALSNFGGSSLAGQNNQQIQRIRLGLNHQNLSGVLHQILTFKVREFKNLDIAEVSQYLSLNSVDHEVQDNQIIISTKGQSSLNRFARRVSVVARSRNEISPTGITSVIFNPSLVSGKTQGLFYEDKSFLSENSSIVTGASNTIFLSLEALLKLQPTDVEFHELIHWKAFFARALLDVSSVVQGHVDVGGAKSEARSKMDQNQSFSLEELQAHLLGLSKALRKYNQTKDPEELEDLGYQISFEMASLTYYASKTKPMVLDFFKRSIFKDLKDDTSITSTITGLSLSNDFIEVVNFDWLEEIGNHPGQGSLASKRVIDYQFSNYQKRSWLYVIVPLPATLKDVEDYRRLHRPEYQKAFNDLSNSIHYKMLYLLKLIEFIEGLSLQIENNEIIRSSPIQNFHELNRQLNEQLQNL